jgi:hypothetical protein
VITELDLRYLRQQAIEAHQVWKSELLMCDAVARGDWEVMWPDGSVDSSSPLVENLYSQTLKDKTLTAGAVPLSLFTPPTRGTRKDEGEKNASKRKRVGLSYWERSNLRKMRQRLYRDWLHAGVMCANPWATGFAGPNPRPSASRFAYFEVTNPRHLYPLGWDSRGRLVAGLIIRQRRVADLEADWGRGHPAIVSARIRHASARSGKLVWLEEIWYMDEDHWAVALGDSGLPLEHQGVQFGPADGFGSVIVEWIVEPHKHKLGSCPIKASARVTYNDSPRGALMDIIPALRIAQNFMARTLDDLNASVYAPVVLDNIENPEEYGLGAVLVGNGLGKAFIDRDRPPVNFEAQQTVERIMDGARRDAFEPAQRSGEAGASIVSDKGVKGLMGTFNAELAAAQGDAEMVVADVTSITAGFDQIWCAGEKEINVVDPIAESMSEESYDPVQLFKMDWRYACSYGDRTGLDEQQHLTRLALARNLEGISRRTFMERSGMTQDALAEETEMGIEKLIALFTDQILPQTVMSGDTTALVQFIDLIDSDNNTMREAVYETIRKAQVPPAPEAGQGGPMSPGGRADIMKMVRSLGAGGIPGQAEGMPPTMMPGGGPPGGGPPGMPQLPGPARRLAAAGAPGGTAT